MMRSEAWSAVYPESRDALGARLAELMKKASHRWGGMRWPPEAIPPGGVRPENVVYTSEDSGEIRHMFVVLTGRTIGPSRLGAAYPFAPHGTLCEVEIGELHPHETGIEGEVTARVAGAEIRFFEPLWGLKRGRYRPGAVQRVRFAGFGHALQATNTAEAEPQPEGQPVAAKPLLSADAVASEMIMIGPGPSSRYGMHAPIVEWRGYWVGERLYYALKLRLAADAGREFAVDVYAGRHCFKGNFAPAPGIALTGVVWLHGTLAE